MITVSVNRKVEPIRNVLSLFDGISCGQLALQRANISYERYYASEIEEASIKVTQANFPNTIQLGDVTKIKDFPEVDLLIAGSPCQGFSKSGSKLNFDDPRSVLFFEFLRVLKTTQPKYFLLENVVMDQWATNVISYYLRTNPYELNSSLVSAQNRPRYYWTNLPFPKITKTLVSVSDIAATSSKNLLSDTSLEFISCPPSDTDTGLIFVGGFKTRNQTMWIDNGKLLSRNFRQGYRVYSSKGKSSTLTASGGGLGGCSGLYQFGDVVRPLSRLECERLQTVPDNYTDCVSDSQAKKALGNGFTVDMVASIFGGLSIPNCPYN